ncbi:Putative transport integral membrane protein [Salinisphaera shabanensis E1L3A]|jgi:CIC family chloride channel protein|uniref:Transport integral membrane protein n=1 Tax=Salinisphaera shabanensis E1L3A TaxID=1033802 RepID=U2FWF3_9GAMM|nr:chloride channel protein [Salinisphaera shabanensis]ERJ18563.1 Putative transport integral membrane protein [Salinisphaera shabanensis E1L3A]
MAAERSRRRMLREAWQGRMDSMRQHLADVENTPGLTLLCLLGAATGALCGLVILALHTGIHLLQDPLFELFGVSGGGFTETSVAFRVAVPLLGALLLGLIVEWVLKSAEYGIVHIIERLVYYQGVLPVKSAVAEFTMSVLALTTGQSVGREGVAAHTGATTGSWLGRRLDLPNNSVRTLVGCGAAAGVAASFNTPLAAVIFAMEVVMMEYTIAGFAPIILAAVSGSLVTFTFTDVHPRLVAEYSGFSPIELPYLAFVGAVVGIAGAGFTRLCGALVPLLAKIRISLRIALAGLVTGLLAIQFPQIMGLGFDTVNGSLAGQYAVTMALGIGVAKLIATSFATAAAIPGGVILPTFVIGSALGSALGTAGALILPGDATDAGLYALLGIGAMMGAVLQAPLSALVVILELSGQTGLVLPGMLVVIAALVVSRRISVSESLFRLLLRRRGLDYRNDPISQYLRRASVLSAMNRRFRIVEPKIDRAALDEILENKIDWLLIRSREHRASLMRPGDVARFLNQEENDQIEEIDLYKIPGKRMDAYSIHVRASLQEAFDMVNRNEAEALIVERNVVGSNAITYGVLTREAIDGTYRP